MKAGVTINRPPRDGQMAFVRSPDRQSIELLQKGAALPPKEPWASMPNTGALVEARHGPFRPPCLPPNPHYTTPGQNDRSAPFVYRLGRHPFTVERAVRFR